MIHIGYAEFIKLCRVDNPADWSGFSVRHDGVYVMPPPDDVTLTPTERAVLSEHPTKDLTAPVLKFPCSLSQLQSFLEQAGGYGSIDPFDMADFVQKEIKLQKEKAGNTSLDLKPNLKSQESLLKMIISMAVDSYGYVPSQSKSPFPSELTDIIHKQGLNIDIDTVRKWLKEAAELLPRE